MSHGPSARAEKMAKMAQAAVGGEPVRDLSPSAANSEPLATRFFTYFRQLFSTNKFPAPQPLMFHNRNVR